MTLEETTTKRRYPRVIGVVATYVGSSHFALRVVMKAVRGEALYKQVVREAWQRRRVKRWQRKLTRN